MYLYVKMMNIKILSLDHVVFTVADPQRSLHFYSETLGLRKERAREYAAGRVPFPSVRINEQTILDFLQGERRTGMPSGNVDHIALTLGNTPQEIRDFLKARNVEIVAEMTGNFGAAGDDAHSFHVFDPDGNVLELQTYSGD
jgi:catechol 2,3-dioxygenase-like lactoylglutathione lyase family enzyme